MTRDKLNELYNEFYGTKHDNAVVTNQSNVRCKLSKKTVLFTDEFSRAQKDVHNACLQLVLERKLHNHVLPYVDGIRTTVIAGDNPDNGDYAVESLDPATLDRFCSVDVEVDVPSWLDWARKNKVQPIVTAFIADNPSKLHWSPEEGSETVDGSADRVGATPRSWTKLAKFVENMINGKTPTELHYPILKGKVGSALASQFLTFMNNYNDIISVEDIEALVKKVQKKTQNIEDIGKAVQELTEKLEAIQITELNHAMVQKYINKEDLKDVIPMMAMLYSLQIETLAGFLKSYKDESKENYTKIAQFDKELNKKGLFIKIVSRT